MTNDEPKRGTAGQDADAVGIDGAAAADTYWVFNAGHRKKDTSKKGYLTPLFEIHVIYADFLANRMRANKGT